MTNRERMMDELVSTKAELESRKYEICKEIWQIEYKLSLIWEKIKKYGLEKDLGVVCKFNELEKNNCADLCSVDLTDSGDVMRGDTRSNANL